MDALNKFVRWSPEVKEFLGPDALTTLCRSAGDYTCITCSKPGKATRERTSVIVVKGTPEAPPVVQLAHARCAPSQIITLDTVYDSTLLGSNDFTALFSEEGWLVAKRGHDSRKVSVPICPDGATHAGIAIDCDGSAGA